MKKAFGILKLSLNLGEGKQSVYNYVSKRGARFQDTLNWVKPQSYEKYELPRMGDRSLMPELEKNQPFLDVKNSKTLQEADDSVKKVFSLEFQKNPQYLFIYMNELVEKVKNHKYDTSSYEVRIAKLTARIRYYQKLIEIKPSKFYRERSLINTYIDQRKKLLKILRNEDYAKFEWILEELDLEFKPVPTPYLRHSRKKSLMMLAKLQVEQAKEARLAELKQSYDEQKVPFLEKKIAKLKEIKEKEEKYQLEPTVTEDNINECIKKLERVKVEVAERAKRGYKRKIHPYLLEPFDEKLLEEKEQAEHLRRKNSVQKENTVSS